MIKDSILHEQARGLVEKYLHARRKSADSMAMNQICMISELSIERTSGRFVSDCAANLSKSPKSDMQDVSNTVTPADAALINDGTERRTTLMIKKVPRKYTLETLRREIDKVLSVSGAYDLLYLPVDSAKMTNRGYAFINFTSSKHVEVFLREFLNRQWSELNRRGKAAGLHWAYVQGRDETLSHIKTEVMDK